MLGLWDMIWTKIKEGIKFVINWFVQTIRSMIQWFKDNKTVTYPEIETVIEKKLKLL